MNRDWKAEALQFMRDNNVTPQDVSLGVVQKAMEHGAVIAVTHAVGVVGAVGKKLARARAKNMSK